MSKTPKVVTGTDTTIQATWEVNNAVVPIAADSAVEARLVSSDHLTVHTPVLTLSDSVLVRIGARREGHSKSTKDARRRLRAATGIEEWTAHDLRRTCRTIMAREGVLPHIAEQVLGYTQGGVEGIYDQYTYLKEKRNALEKVDNAIGKILGIRKDQAKVVELRRVG